MGDSGLDVPSVVPILALVGVIAFTGYTAGTAYLDYTSEKTQVTGTVVSSEVDRDTGGRRSGVSFYPEVTYTYEYEGETYTSSNLKPGEGSSSMSRSQAEEIVAEHPEGATVTVYVDTADPSNAWLQDKLPVGNIATSLLIGVGAVVIFYLRFVRGTGD